MLFQEKIFNFSQLFLFYTFQAAGPFMTQGTLPVVPENIY